MRIVLASHGTRDPRGQQMGARLVSAVQAALPDHRVELGWIQNAAPSLADLLAGEQADVVVPVLLGTGYHVTVDIPRIVAEAGSTAVITPHLGPVPTVIAAVTERVRAVDADPVAVVLAAAGTSHPVGRSEARQAADVAADQLNAAVRVAYASGEGPGVRDVVAQFLADGAARVTVAPYLLAPGFFSDRIAGAARRSGATCADIMDAHPGVVETIVARVQAVLRTPAHAS